MFYCQASGEEFIFKQNDNASSFFIIEKGSCQVIINEQIKRILKSGDGFGDLALLYNSPRSGSIKALEPIFLWGIERNTFRQAIEDISVRDYEVHRKFINEIKFFSNEVFFNCRSFHLFLNSLYYNLILFTFICSFFAYF